MKKFFVLIALLITTNLSAGNFQDAMAFISKCNVKNATPTELTTGVILDAFYPDAAICYGNANGQPSTAGTYLWTTSFFNLDFPSKYPLKIAQEIRRPVSYASGKKRCSGIKYTNYHKLPQWAKSYTVGNSFVHLFVLRLKPHFAHF